jgi:hypothetical protein
MASIESPIKTCSDCASLIVGKLSDPHRYLMAYARAAHSLFYHCLICDSDLTCELEDWAPRWRSHDANLRPSMQK